MEIEDPDDAKKKKIIDNLAYDAWLEQDQAVVSYLVNSLSPDVLSHVVGLETTAEIWAAITEVFASQSQSRVQHLRTALNNTKKREMTTAQYFTTMKGFRSELAVAGKTIDDDELIGYILNGLDKSYNSLVSSVNGNPCTSLTDLFGQMNSHDMRQKMLQESGEVDEFSSSVNAAQHGRDDRPRGGGGDCYEPPRGRTDGGGDHGDRDDRYDG
jgi:hypothetical protein